MKYTYLFSFVLSIQISFAQSVKVHTIYFKKNSYSIQKKYDPKVEKLAKIINTDLCTTVKIYGYTDTSGSEDYNEYLSKKRAYAVYNFILSKAKIDTTKFYLEWLGESGEIYDLHLPNAHAQARAVDIVLYIRTRRDLPHSH